MTYRELSLFFQRWDAWVIAVAVILAASWPISVVIRHCYNPLPKYKDYAAWQAKEWENWGRFCYFWNFLDWSSDVIFLGIVAYFLFRHFVMN